jgi:hypothetical protein
MSRATNDAVVVVEEIATITEPYDSLAASKLGGKAKRYECGQHRRLEAREPKKAGAKEVYLDLLCGCREATV